MTGCRNQPLVNLVIHHEFEPVFPVADSVGADVGGGDLGGEQDAPRRHHRQGGLARQAQLQDQHQGRGRDIAVSRVI